MPFLFNLNFATDNSGTVDKKVPTNYILSKLRTLNNDRKKLRETMKSGMNSRNVIERRNTTLTFINYLHENKYSHITKLKYAFNVSNTHSDFNSNIIKVLEYFFMNIFYHRTRFCVISCSYMNR